ncbi:MAG: RNA methyltransferase [Candidatus Micrarchaeota archaeon]|nr:RNA methyltransferase [Candidatus Micrarchaeota archaeon]MDE1847322.1 RNA methyltransferase [Candidatus Micrarchaeota archaeon]MDE1863937.1 RNA methyltransferase [Candidatus Micrarchaeota archaeon]
MILKLVVVSPKYQNNLGYIARVASNFGIKKLHIVAPRAKITGKDAIMYSKHAHSLIERASIYKNLEDALEGCDIAIGTTGIWEKARAGFRGVSLPDELEKRLQKAAFRNTNVALVIGRDDTGLSKEEMELCNILAYIPTSPSYPVLNVSHALAILLFFLTRTELGKNYRIDPSEKPDKKEILTLYKMLGLLMADKKIREKETVKRIFVRLLSLAQPTKKEVHALITALK